MRVAGNGGRAHSEVRPPSGRPRLAQKETAQSQKAFFDSNKAILDRKKQLIFKIKPYKLI